MAVPVAGALRQQSVQELLMKLQLTLFVAHEGYLWGQGCGSVAASRQHRHACGVSISKNISAARFWHRPIRSRRRHAATGQHITVRASIRGGTHQEASVGQADEVVCHSTLDGCDRLDELWLCWVAGDVEKVQRRLIEAPAVEAANTQHLHVWVGSKGRRSACMTAERESVVLSSKGVTWHRACHSSPAQHCTTDWWWSCSPWRPGSAPRGEAHFQRWAHQPR